LLHDTQTPQPCFFSVQAQAEKQAQEAKLLQDAMDREKAEMAERMEALQNNIKEDSSKFSEGNESLKKDNQKLLEQMEKERQELEQKLAQDKANLERKLLEDSNRLEQEKADMAEKLAKENELLAQKMHEEKAKQSEEKNEILQLYEKVQRDIEARKQETQKLKDQMQTEQADVREFISRGTSQFRELLDIEKKDRATQMAETQSDLEALMDKTESDSHQIELMQRIIQDVEYMAVTPLSVYFTAHRAEPYTGGGEEFLTFDGCSVNVGNAMDAKSGIFTAPFSAAYLFSLHVCTHDLKKALIAIRRNGIEVASIYDQVRNIILKLM
jgi:hypothetical protein